MIPTTWLSLPCALVRDAITSCSRVRMVRADCAAVVGGGGALVIATLLTEAGDERYCSRASFASSPVARAAGRERACRISFRSPADSRLRWWPYRPDPPERRALPSKGRRSRGSPHIGRPMPRRRPDIWHSTRRNLGRADRRWLG